MRRLLKRAVEVGLEGGGAARLLRRPGDVAVLAYHNIVPRGEARGGDLSLHLPQEMFARQLDRLLETHDVVSLAEFDREATGGRPRAVITFDDAYRGAMTAGIDELVQRGVSATVFVAPAFPGGTSFWWDALAGKNGQGLRPEIRDTALGLCAGENERVRSWAMARGLRWCSVPGNATVSSLDELKDSVSRHSLLTFGAHTWSHPNLQALSGARLTEELAKPLLWLREHAWNVIPWLAYPYGHYSDEAQRSAIACGYEGAFRVDGGPVRKSRPNPRFALSRINVPAGLSLEGFSLRLAGVLS